MTKKYYEPTRREIERMKKLIRAENEASGPKSGPRERRADTTWFPPVVKVVK